MMNIKYADDEVIVAINRDDLQQVMEDLIEQVKNTILIST